MSIRLYRSGTNDQSNVKKNAARNPAIVASPTSAPPSSYASGIITDQGGTLSHAAIIAREYKIPTLIGTECATKIFQNVDRVRLETSLGEARKL